MQKFVDVGLKILAVLVIPLIAWGIRLEVSLAVMQSELDRAQADVAIALAIKDSVIENEKTLIRMDGKLGAVSTTLTEIKGILDK